MEHRCSWKEGYAKELGETNMETAALTRAHPQEHRRDLSSTRSEAFPIYSSHVEMDSHTRLTLVQRSIERRNELLELLGNMARHDHFEMGDVQQAVTWRSHLVELM